jgi:hypothetical protein
MSCDTHFSPPCAGTPVGTGPVVEELRSFEEHLRDVQGLSPGTRRGYLRVAGGLLRRQLDSGPIDIADTPLKRYRAPDTMAELLRSLRL